MTTLTSITLPAPAVSRESNAVAAFKSTWQQLFTRMFRPYRPELHYMRGPGPAWRAKYGDPASFRLRADLD